MHLDSENLYFRDINRFKLLTKAQERAIIARVQRNEPGAADELTKANLRFVVSIARVYRGRGLGFLDLINEGNIGLIKAAKRFNLAIDVKFISYAVWWIRQSIQKAIFEKVGVVRLPLNKIALLREFKLALERNRGDYFRTIMMDAFLPHESDIVDIMNKAKAISLETPLNSPRSSDDGNEGAKTLQDLLGEEPNQESEHERKELGAALKNVLRKVPSRQERILRMYFGINLNRQFTLEEIGKDLNLTRERVRLLRDKALRHLLRNPDSRARLSPFLEPLKSYSLR